MFGGDQSERTKLLVESRFLLPCWKFVLFQYIFRLFSSLFVWLSFEKTSDSWTVFRFKLIRREFCWYWVNCTFKKKVYKIFMRTKGCKSKGSAQYVQFCLINWRKLYRCIIGAPFLKNYIKSKLRIGLYLYSISFLFLQVLICQFWLPNKLVGMSRFEWIMSLSRTTLLELCSYVQGWLSLVRVVVLLICFFLFTFQVVFIFYFRLSMYFSQFF